MSGSYNAALSVLSRLMLSELQERGLVAPSLASSPHPGFPPGSGDDDQQHPERNCQYALLSGSERLPTIE